jgi:hypothetical protein
MPEISGETLRAWRRARGWDVPETARQLRRAAGNDPLPVHDALVRMIYRWERLGLRTERYELLYRRLGFNASPPGRADSPASREIPAARGTVPCSRLDALSTGQLDELMRLLDDQWHVLVRTDNLLGPRHTLGGVLDQIGLVDALLRSVRPPARHQVLQLAAKYAESAA